MNALRKKNFQPTETEVVAKELSDLVNYMRAMGKLTSFAESESIEQNFFLPFSIFFLLYLYLS